MLNGFLLGVIVTASLTAAAFFFRFWRRTRDILFLGFAASFLIEGLNRLGFLFLAAPNEGAPLLYTVRLFSYLLILAAILNKNRG
ncbi:MAG TPA: DUF5985 family protein [Myxococcota bacterium]|nr:DUF5985 family protein [Myxococcota bacterium]